MHSLVPPTHREKKTADQQAGSLASYPTIMDPAAVNRRGASTRFLYICASVHARESLSTQQRESRQYAPNNGTAHRPKD